ncbi:FAD-dependent oxidoreductase [Frigidibacter sp. RF13]|uniref:NAD(P)/FAD-dependent oxidoreductase n=1 Tax=Frigidibacter sp. RF13 TaxID=2997340 RepID=UPI0022715044|nr:FAD-dependent oxidoreductase [Frigidibacter sp. RF13]MCY1127418.1 FAD-dependent oxidoreductase [Frigidibacter sp. RF13]
MSETTEIAVIGAGVIGLAIAHRLALAGREVLVFDPNEPGSGASYGNAGTIADYAAQPVGTPDVLKNLPSLLFDRNSPLAIRRAALPSLAPWLLRFARQSLPGAARRNAMVLAGLLADATPRWQALATEIGGADLLQDRGCLYWYQTDAAYRAAKADISFRQSLGVTVELIDAAELQSLEPTLPVTEGGAAFFPNARFMTDPGQMVTRLARAAEAAGATFRRTKVTGLSDAGTAMRLQGDGLDVLARHVILAAGAHSRALARQADDRVPLDTERGYHLEWDMTAPRLTRPTCPTARGFYLCPMQGRLRVAGTVELGGLTAPPSPHRLAKLEEGARSIFPDLPAPSRTWMGFRPSMPDSLPVVGPSRAGNRVIHAYGHGHIGLTLAPVTAELVERCLTANTGDARLAALSPARF